MAKKIYDIIPPHLAHRIEDVVGEFSSKSQKKAKRAVSSAKRHKAKKRSLPVWELSIGGLIIVLLLSIYGYYAFEKAEVAIWPETKPMNFEEIISANRSANAIDIKNSIIPAYYVEEQKEDSKEFKATGISSNDTKASGVITVYNKTSPSAPLVLKSGTHFLSDSGKYFVTLEKITVPAMEKNAPGAILAKVQAEQAGEEYNIKPSKFSIPKLSGTAYYYSIWADSKSPMAGGSSGTIKKATKEDIEQAKNILAESLFIQATESLKSRIPKEDILLEGTLKNEVTNSISSEKENAEASEFTETVKVKISSLVFKKKDLEDFAKDYLVAKLDGDHALVLDSLDISYGLESFNMQDGVLKIAISLSAKSYEKIPSDKLISDIADKSSKEANEIISKEYGNIIISSKIDFWPFWVKKVPRDKEKVIVRLNFQ